MPHSHPRFRRGKTGNQAADRAYGAQDPLEPYQSTKRSPILNPDDYFAHSPYTSNKVLDCLIAAGLGGTSQSLITPAQLAAALRGETVKPTAKQVGKATWGETGQAMSKVSRVVE